MDTTLILVFTAVFVLVAYFLSSKQKNLPPGPPAYPIIGAVPFLKKFRHHRFKTMMKLSKEYGSDVISVRFGSQLFVFLQGHKAIQQAFVKQSEVFSDRPNWLRGLQPAIKGGKGVLWQNGHAWKTLRRFTLQTLRDFGVGKTSLEEKILLEIEAVTNHFTDLDGELTEVKRLMTMMISNVIYSICFGRRYEYDDAAFHDLLNTLDKVFKNPSMLSPRNFMPAWISTFVWPETKHEVEERSLIREKIQNYIYEQIEEHQATFDRNNVRDFVDLYIQTSRDEANSDEDVFTKGNIFRVIVDLFLAGSETTSTSLDWCFLFLIEYPEVQEKCYRELVQNIGHRDVRWSDKGKCPYTEATLLEIQRLANIAGFSVPHATNKDTSLLGYTIPKGTIVMGNLYSSHMDPEHFPEPELFTPERFLNQDGKLVREDTLIPFSIGPRVCLGESLAKMELFLVFSNLILRFRFERENGAPRHTFLAKTNQLTNIPTSYRLCATRRT